MQADDFNTSHVSINRGSSRTSQQHRKISIHLMFLLIRDSLEAALLGKISIHLMFLLIGSGSLPKFLDANFNTSHVSINRVPSAITAFCFWKFNTSHVSINLVPTDANYRYTLEFQYISCFY